MDSGVNPEEMGSYLEGDIMVHNSRNGLTAETARWLGGIVPYEMGAYFSKYVRRSYDWRGLQDAKKDVRLCAQFLMLHLI
jgi:hypothetical protein